MEGEAEGNHFSRGEPSEELDCTPLADVIVETVGLRKPHFPPPATALRNTLENTHGPTRKCRKKNGLMFKAGKPVSYRSLVL